MGVNSCFFNGIERNKFQQTLRFKKSENSSLHSLFFSRRTLVNKRQCKLIKRIETLTIFSSQNTYTESKSRGSTIIAADIGGTNARFQIWRLYSNEKVDVLLAEKEFKCKDFGSFELCITELYESTGILDVDYACFAVAGPVHSNSCQMTNLNWKIDGDLMQQKFNIRKVQVLNDFEAIGYGIHELEDSDLLILNSCSKNPTGPIALIGPGTGLGEALIFWNNALSQYEVHSSEGSHGRFAPVGELQIKLLKFVEQDLEECEVEHVCCGAGLTRIYNFLCLEFKTDKPVLGPAEITENALSGTCRVCFLAVKMFLEILGTEAANLGLKSLATGGVYIAGGIPARIKTLLKDGTLLESFIRKNSRTSTLLSTFPLMVILNPSVGLLGSKTFAKRFMN